jgi:uncharacterized protein DUF6941
MELDFALLADGVTSRPDGKLDIYGAGFDAVIAPAVPAIHPRLVLAVRVLISTHEAEHEHRLDVVLHATDGAELARALWPFPALNDEQRATIPPGRQAGAGAVLTFENVVFPAYGAYHFVLQWDGTEVRAPLRLFVVEPEP